MYPLFPVREPTENWEEGVRYSHPYDKGNPYQVPVGTGSPLVTGSRWYLGPDGTSAMGFQLSEWYPQKVGKALWLPVTPVQVAYGLPTWVSGYREPVSFDQLPTRSPVTEFRV